MRAKKSMKNLTPLLLVVALGLPSQAKDRGSIIQLDQTMKVNTASVTSTKNPWVAFALSFTVPGAGQFYNGEPKKAIAMLAGMIGGLAFTTYSQTDDNELNARMGVGILVMAGCSIWSMIDAPLSAERINKERGLVKSWEGGKMLLSVAPINTQQQIGAGLTLTVDL